MMTRKMNPEIALTKTNYDKTLVVLTGPTAVGKTELSLEIAGHLNAEIISADARQFYRELVIGTAAPTPGQLARVAHHLVGHLSIYDYYNVSVFEKQALEIAERLFQQSDFVVVTGGSGLYIDALCHGIDELPESDPAIRAHVKDYYRQHGLDALRLWLKKTDPEFYEWVDLANPNRIMRAIEVYLATGKKFSELRTRQTATRPFQIKKVIINRDRAELFGRINERVDQMVQQGLIEEALSFFRPRHLNALNTVGYKELFAWLSGEWPLHTAIEKIKTHTRRYAKRQLTWFRRYDDAQWFHPGQQQQIIDFIKEAGK